MGKKNDSERDGGKKLIDFIRHPEMIKTLSIEEIDQWIEEAPYMQNLHLIKAIKLKSLYGDEPSLFHKAATMMTDRLKLQKVLDGVELAAEEARSANSTVELAPDQEEDEKQNLAIDRELLNVDSRELSEFSQWLLALRRPDDIIDEKRIDASTSPGGAAISETLAQILEKQGHNDKAIEMYEKLQLINPEKSAYFEALIEKLKKK